MTNTHKEYMSVHWISILFYIYTIGTCTNLSLHKWLKNCTCRWLYFNRFQYTEVRKCTATFSCTITMVSITVNVCFEHVLTFPFLSMFWTILPSLLEKNQCKWPFGMILLYFLPPKVCILDWIQWFWHGYNQRRVSLVV